MKKYKFRKAELILVRKIGVTKEVHSLLRKQKRKQEKSMARIVCDLIMEKYKK